MNGDIEARVRRANPLTRDEHLERIFGEDVSHRLLARVHDRNQGRHRVGPIRVTASRVSSTPTSSETESTAPQVRRLEPRRALAGVLAGFMAALAVGAVVVLAVREPGVGAGPMDTARGFIEARNAYDADTMRSLFAADSAIGGELVPSVDEYEAVAGFEQATGWTYWTGECTATPIGESVRLFCPYDWENDWTRALDLGRVSGSSFQFIVADGQIQDLANAFSLDGFTQVWDEFLGWLEETHPDEVAAMVDQGAFAAPLDPPRLTPDAIDLWKRYTEEFVASHAGSAGSSR